MNISENKFKFYGLVVKRLIMQFKEYEYLSSQIKEIENKKFISKLKRDTSSIKELDEKLNLLKIDHQKVSDEMTFPNPIVWMMYKYKAYKNTNNEIKTVEDFINHCRPEGYICTKRYKFLSEYININKLFKLNDNLSKVYKSEALLRITENTRFMKSWKQNEYLIKDDVITKWKCNVN